MDKPKEAYIFFENFEVVKTENISDSELYERGLTQSNKNYGGDNLFKI